VLGVVELLGSRRVDEPRHLHVVETRVFSHLDRSLELLHQHHLLLLHLLNP
jgi:hypothetical protein